MYGLVNKALKDLVVSRSGQEVWHTICVEAGVDMPDFIRMESYPDDITYRLVYAASRTLNAPAEQLLQEFGEHWTVYTAQEGYGDMFKAYGSSLKALLQNLDDLHARVGLIYPSMDTPHFCCTDVTDTSLVFHYYSHRQGLAPMVVGLVKGLGILFKTPLSITHTLRRDEGADHDAFLLSFSAS